ncbi:MULTISPECIES: ABC transporter substrate-binding protein [Bosea]|jgi:branched-chain amino acid transport system substrate-binding protein|uniref:ABC transporter substrate-binding protein n=1 Tax=Bosea vaviloviae TaxID=1526658 RepID=A0A0N0MCK9_9HYPH|nr:ABC transporter substrate-binding protein [Bosea vaviloviae]KPH82317.1 ABC transporter substrate-binding protein [Bosea vaviloviae]
MTIDRRSFLAGASAGATVIAAPSALWAQGAGPIKVGEINSYTAQPAFLKPYRQGWELALEQINAGGGVLGRKIETIFRDDAGKPEDAVRHAGDLINAEKVDLLSGGFLSNVGLAIADFALQNKKLYVASEPLSDAIVWAKGNRYTFRLRPSTYMQAAMLVEEAAKLPAKKWAIVAPNYEYGQSAVKWFTELLKKAKPDVEFATPQFPALGRIDAGATVQALEASKPDAIFNVTFGGDLTNFVRQGNTRGLFEGRTVVSMLTGEPEYLDPLGAEAPVGWIVTGYPQADIKTPEHVKFREAYMKKFNDYPRLGSVVGFDTMNSIAAALTKAGSTDTEKLVDALKGLKFPSAFGAAEYRAVDHQSTLGAFVGKTALKDGKGVMVDWSYRDGAKYLPSDAEVKLLRPAG